MRALRKRVHMALDFDQNDNRLDQFVSFAILVLIALNVMVVIAGSVPTIQQQYRVLFWRFEFFSVAVFSVEYLLRIWSCVEEERFASPISGRLRYATSAFGLIDLVAILPFYIGTVELGLRTPMRSARVFRLFALLRILKIGRYSSAVNTLARVLRDKREELVITAALGGMLLLCASATMFVLEHQDNPEDFSSIPASMWWGITTLTTVGYGDATPVTPMGKLVAGGIQILGLIMFALPAGVLASGFTDELKRQRAEATICPHCGGSFPKG
ncbi:MAG: ion transporter [Candidatus Binatia bacterium]|nr:ion transporter [Candidatus Binatia bacterium]